MQAFEIRNLTDDDIQTKLEESYEELFMTLIENWQAPGN